MTLNSEGVAVAPYLIFLHKRKHIAERVTTFSAISLCWEKICETGWIWGGSETERGVMVDETMSWQRKCYYV